MRRLSFQAICLFVVLLLSGLAVWAADAGDQSWPPALTGAVNGTVTFTSDLFLKIPANVQEELAKPGAVPFVLAKTAPTVDFAFHGNLPDRALNGTGWSAWGDICLAGDGRVYAGIGDHGDDMGGKSHAYVYQWDPATKVLKQIVDLNAIMPRTKGEPSWSKLHARITEGPDGTIYFTGTLNDGNRANEKGFNWSETIPGGQLYQYNPTTGKASLFCSLPPAHCTATTMLDRKRNIWWCNLEAGPNGLMALDLATKQIIYQAPAGSMKLNRNFALARNGVVYFNGVGGIWKCDLKTKSISPTRSSFGKDDNGGMRSSTDESKKGWIYGVCMETKDLPTSLFRYSPKKDKLELLGKNFVIPEYTTVCVLSPDEKYLYYLPGSHGGAFGIGTPVIQYNIAKHQQKVLAFMRGPLESIYHYVPAGSYGVKISADGSTLYVNFNGHAADDTRPKPMTASGFGLTGFAAIHIPASER